VAIKAFPFNEDLYREEKPINIGWHPLRRPGEKKAFEKRSKREGGREAQRNKIRRPREVFEVADNLLRDCRRGYEKRLLPEINSPDGEPRGHKIWAYRGAVEGQGNDPAQ